MLQVKFSVEKNQVPFLNKFKVYGFKDKSAMFREAISLFKKEIELESLRKSAELNLPVLPGCSPESARRCVGCRPN